MRTRYFLMALALAAASSLAGCTDEVYQAASKPAGPVPVLVATHADSALAAAGLPSVGKLVIRGPVTFQVAGPHSTQTASAVGKDKTGQHAQALSTGDNSPVTASEKKGTVPWWVYALAALVGAVVWEYLSHLLKPLGLLRWRAPPTA